MINEIFSRSDNLTKEEIANIKRASSAKKLRLRGLQGCKSLKNPLKLMVMMAYIAAAVALFIKAGWLAEFICNPASRIYTFVVVIFQITIITTEILFFLALIVLLGTNIIWAEKLENACISAGIYTKARKAPFLLNRYKEKETPVLKILEIYLNGNTVEDFQSKKKELQSELGWYITEFESKGTSRILLYTSRDNISPRKRNSDDMTF